MKTRILDRLVRGIALAVLISIVSASAHAMFLFTVSRTDGLGEFESLEWMLPDGLTTDASEANFIIQDLVSDYTCCEVLRATVQATVTFLDSGGMVVSFEPPDFTIVTLSLLEGPRLFGGSLLEPFFMAGTFELGGFFETGSDQFPGLATLVISEVPVGVIPEPATWTMLITGFGIMCAGLWRRRMVIPA